MKRAYLLELLIVTLIGCIAFATHAPTIPQDTPSPALLDLSPITKLFADTGIRPIGLEHERLAGAIVPIQVGIQHYGHIPYWNSYLSNGVPLINNAFSYLFNPVHSLPVLIFGGVTGSKIAILIALLIAAYNMWAFALALGLGSIARVTTALLYMLNGGLIAKFGAGHFQLAASLAWPPLVFATLWWTLRSTKRRALIAVGISFALLFYAGNIYYVLHTLIGCIFIVAFSLILRKDGHWHFCAERLYRALIAAAIAFGFCALQFFPIWQTRDFVTHEQQQYTADGSLANSYSLNQAFANLSQPYQDWVLNQPTPMFLAVDYTYIGKLVFVLILLATLIIFFNRIQTKKPLHPPWIMIAVAMILAIAMMLWASGQAQPIPWLYANVPLLAQFRFLGRALAIAALWWIVLAGISLDLIWSFIQNFRLPALKRLPRFRLALFLALATLSWGYLFIYSASNGPARIGLVLRNIELWPLLDTLRYPTLIAALTGLVTILTITAAVETLLRLIKHSITHFVRHQPHPFAPLMAHAAQIAVLSILAFGILDTLIANLPALQFMTGAVPFDTIYDDIHRADPNTAVPAVTIPFSPFTIGAYEREIRVWSLNEGWLPAAPTKSALLMPTLLNLSRWLIAERKDDGSFQDPHVETIIKETPYELRACYVQDSDLQLANCAIRAHGFTLYEYPQALPYAFVVSDPILTTTPKLHADQVTPVDVIQYRQDTIVIHATVPTTDFNKNYLVVQESNFPGWQAYIDDQPTTTATVPIYVIGQQTLGLIAIPTQRGDHTYTLRFDPPGLSTGIGVFLATLILITLYVTFKPKQKSPAAARDFDHTSSL